jgi:hypothetical protein
MGTLRKQYRDLEMRLYSELRDLISKSDYSSKYINEKAIQVFIDDYEELAIINDRLTFLANGGYHYACHINEHIEDLITILEPFNRV